MCDRAVQGCRDVQGFRVLGTGTCNAAGGVGQDVQRFAVGLGVQQGGEGLDSKAGRGRVGRAARRPMCVVCQPCTLHNNGRSWRGRWPHAPTGDASGSFNAVVHLIEAGHHQVVHQRYLSLSMRYYIKPMLASLVMHTGTSPTCWRTRNDSYMPSSFMSPASALTTSTPMRELESAPCAACGARGW